MDERWCGIKFFYFIWQIFINYLFVTYEIFIR